MPLPRSAAATAERHSMPLGHGLLGDGCDADRLGEAGAANPQQHREHEAETTHGPD